MSTEKLSWALIEKPEANFKVDFSLYIWVNFLATLQLQAFNHIIVSYRYGAG